MKLSLRGEYALRALVCLGLNPSSRVMPIGVIAEKESIPKRFLEQILNELRAYGIVESRRGIAGGYRLTRPADQITLAEIWEAIEGPISLVRCMPKGESSSCSCWDSTLCSVSSVMGELSGTLKGVLDGISLAEFCDRSRRLQCNREGVSDYAI